MEVPIWLSSLQCASGWTSNQKYLVAIRVNAERAVVFGPLRVSNYQLEEWILQHLKAEDALVLEMTANRYHIYDSLLPHGENGMTAHAI